MQYLPSQSCLAVSVHADHAAVPQWSVPAAAVSGEPIESGNESAQRPLAASASPAGVQAFLQDASNLVTALRLYADLLQAPGVLPRRYQQYASELRLLADRGAGLLEGLPELLPELLPACSQPSGVVRDGSTMQSRCPEPLCEGGAVLRRCASSLQAQTQGIAHVVLRVPREAQLLPLAGESLEHIAFHLVHNALQGVRAAVKRSEHSPCTVWISLQTRDGLARLAVEHSAPGARTRLAGAASQPLVNGRSACGHHYELRRLQALLSGSGGRLATRARADGGALVTVCWTLPGSTVARLCQEAPLPSSGRTVLAC